ncbi:sugar phosphate isomerase/epimerase family protein [Stratiformator vulcanicus]|uniref:Xylose isomerase-like TIM barrel n=1 Tax=Stratiformator vulcanicus TaxID=2527980 RepID=A0A517R3N4_9PLAN|nr:TIM barrel protein [Stratiformator vulcanicus]QDT38484.1 Xylose isomerase-like TIM barrel [Stratiformator vulcanicus]
MPEQPSVLLSCFADEATRTGSKTAVEQFAAVTALGLKHYTPRFVDVDGSGTIEHVVDLPKAKLKKLAKLQDEYGLSVTSIGSRVGKVKLLDQDDASKNQYVPFDKYLKTEVKRTLEAADALDTKLIRGFSFYHPAGEKPEGYIEAAVERVSALADLCKEQGFVYGLEIEPNLVGENGFILAQMIRAIKNPNLVLIYDGGNIAAQNKTRLICHDEFKAMQPHLGWVHIKDYAIDPNMTWEGHVDEERLKNFVPADIGDSGHDLALRDLKESLPKLTKKMKKLGAPGFFLELEPHLKGGGQFGGYSGPDGLGVACRALCRLLDYVGIDYDLRDFGDIQAARGF